FLMLSSWAGHFGNAAQTDYSAANAALAGLATTLRRDGARVVALDLPPWDGTAMVASIPAPLRAALRAEGVPFLDDATGLDALLRELAAAGPSGEALLGGADLPALERRDVARIRLSVAAHPYLDHHRIEGRPVLPLAAASSYALDGARRVGDGPVALRRLEL